MIKMKTNFSAALENRKNNDMNKAPLELRFRSKKSPGAKPIKLSNLDFLDEDEKYTKEIKDKKYNPDEIEDIIEDVTIRTPSRKIVEKYRPTPILEKSNYKISPSLISSLRENEVEEEKIIDKIELPILITRDIELGKIVFADENSIIWQSDNDYTKYTVNNNVHKWYVNDYIIEEKIVFDEYETITVYDYEEGINVTFSIVKSKGLVSILGNINIETSYDTSKEILDLTVINDKYNGKQVMIVGNITKLICYYVDGKLQGKYYEFRDDGSIKITAEFNDGRLDGKYIKFYRSGVIKKILYFNDGKLDGKCREYYDDPSILMSQKEKGITHHQSNRKKTFIYKNGKLHGKFKKYYPNGVVMKKGYTSYGIYNGEYTSFFEDGSVKIEGTFKNGEPYGLFNFVDMNKNEEKIIFINGKKHIIKT